MTFEDLLLEEMHGRDFGKQQYLRTFKKRPHVSKSKIDAYGNVFYLNPGGSYMQMGYNDLKTRYVASAQLTYDTMLSVYDVNSRSLAAARFLDFTPNIALQLRKFLKSISRPNFEARILGLQDNQERYLPHPAVDFLVKNRLKVYEADLFGRSVRHIAIDIHTGMSYDILMQDRLYKPGELSNAMTFDQFEKNLKA